jgi:hypothetical protein
MEVRRYLAPLFVLRGSDDLNAFNHEQQQASALYT